MLGALIIAVLRNGLTLHGVSGFVQIVAIGVILLGAALVDRIVVARRTARAVSSQLADSGDNNHRVDPPLPMVAEPKS